MFGRKAKKKYADDDGRTVIDMNVDGFPWYNPKRGEKKVAEEDLPTRKELMAMIRAEFAVYLPKVICILLGFGAAMGIIYCWLHGWFVN